MPRPRLTPRPAPELPPHIERDLQRAIAIVIQVRQELTKQMERLEQLETELRLLVNGPDQPLLPLSDRQVEVLRYLVLGESNPQIAARLGVAPATVTGIITRIYRKLDVSNRNEAAFKAWKLGLI
jgi:DNA-binding NarL/FixJ family response regulator